jgi:hypothetical protein
MKKIFSTLISTLSFTSLLFIMGTANASAQYYNYNYGSNYTPYYNTYSNAPSSNSYQFTQGCYVYNYDRYTGITSLLGSNCTTNTYNNNYSYNNGYNYGYNNYTYGYVQPTYTTTYVAPVQNTYTVPAINTYGYNNGYNYGYNNQYATYQYVNGVWVLSNGTNYNTNNTGCYYIGSNMVCR